MTVPEHSSVEEAISMLRDKFELVKSSSLRESLTANDQQDGREFFCKEKTFIFTFFRGRGRALQEISETHTIRCLGNISYRTDAESFLVLEFIKEGSSSSKSQELMGRQLACLHKIKQPFLHMTTHRCHPQPNPQSQTG